MPVMDADYDEDATMEDRIKERYSGEAGMFERLADDGGDDGPARSVEGWVIIACGVHEEAQEDDVFEIFAEFGDIKNLHMNLDRRTGFVKGYCLIEYESKKEAEAAIKGLQGITLADNLGKLQVDWAFTKPSKKTSLRARR